MNVCTYCLCWPAEPGRTTCEPCASIDDADARYTTHLIRAERTPPPEIHTGTDAPRDMYVEEFDGIDVLASA